MWILIVAETIAGQIFNMISEARRSNNLFQKVEFKNNRGPSQAPISRTIRTTEERSNSPIQVPPRTMQFTVFQEEPASLHPKVQAQPYESPEQGDSNDFANSATNFPQENIDVGTIMQAVEITEGNTGRPHYQYRKYRS